MAGTRSDNTSTPAPSGLVLLGRIGAAHGIKGEVRIQSFCAVPLDIASYGPLSTGRGDQSLTIVKARMAGNMVVARLEGVSDRNAAEALNGTELFVAREKLPPENDDDNFYHADLIGLAVRTPEGRTIGTIGSVQDFGAGDVVEIALTSGASALYAFTKANFPEISIAQGHVVLDPPAETEVREAGGESLE